MPTLACTAPFERTGTKYCNAQEEKEKIQKVFVNRFTGIGIG